MDTQKQQSSTCQFSGTRLEFCEPPRAAMEARGPQKTIGSPRLLNF